MSCVSILHTQFVCKLSVEWKSSLPLGVKTSRDSSRLHTGHKQSYFQLGLASVYIFSRCNEKGAPEVNTFRGRQKKPLCGSAFFIFQPPPRSAAFFPCWAHTLMYHRRQWPRTASSRKQRNSFWSNTQSPFFSSGKPGAAKDAVVSVSPLLLFCLERKGLPFTGKRGGDLRWFHLWGNISTSPG